MEHDQTKPEDPPLAETWPPESPGDPPLAETRPPEPPGDPREGPGDPREGPGYPREGPGYPREGSGYPREGPRHATPSPPESPQEPEDEIVEGELIAPGDELPVVVEARVVERPARNSVPAVHTAVAAATGFVAGAATLALLRRYGGRLARDAEALAEGLEQVRRPPRQTTTYLVQIRTIERHDE